MSTQTPDFDGASRDVLTLLTEELSPALLYHNAYHTFEDVLPAATFLAEALQLESECVMLIRTAAVFHDTGFLEQVQDHESRSMRLAGEILPGYGYTAPQIATITRIIAATRLPQRPQSLAEEIICDADLDVLGRDNFLTINRQLLEETRLLTNAPPTELDWYQGQLRFLENHHYFTSAARARRDAGKQRNIANVRQRLASMLGQPGSARTALADNT